MDGKYERKEGMESNSETVTTNYSKFGKNIIKAKGRIKMS